MCTCSVSSSALVSSSAFRVGSSLVSSECSSRSSPSDLARCEAADVEVCISALTSGLDVGVWRELNEKLGGLRSRKRVGTLQRIKTWSVTALQMLITGRLVAAVHERSLSELGLCGERKLDGQERRLVQRFGVPPEEVPGSNMASYLLYITGRMRLETL